MKSPAWIATGIGAAAIAGCLHEPTPPARAAEEPALRDQAITPDPPSAQTKIAWTADARSHATHYFSHRIDDWMTATPRAGSNFACATTCHTSLPWALGAAGGDERGSVNTALYQAVSGRLEPHSDWRKATPYFGTPSSEAGRRALPTESILDAIVMGAVDSNCKRQPTIQAVSAMWSMQRKDGGFDWMDYHNSPWEDGDETLGAALAWRVAPPAWAPPETEHRDRLASFLRENIGGARLFTKAIALFTTASDKVGGVWSDDERRAMLGELLERQGKDGGFSFASLGVGNGSAAENEDPMPTAAALLALCARGATASSEVRTHAYEGAAWLIARQGAEGSFPGRSPNGDTPIRELLATDAATGFSILALDACASELLSNVRSAKGG